jgi:uncharacterized protein YkwD
VRREAFCAAPLVLAALAACGPNPIPPALSSPAITDGEHSIAREIQEMVNEYRKREGLRPVRWRSDLASLALRHSLDMATGREPVGHSGLEGRLMTLTSGGPGDLDARYVLGENVGTSNAPPSRVAAWVTAGWLASAEHLSVIRGCFEEGGVGVAAGNDGRFYVTHLFSVRVRGLRADGRPPRNRCPPNRVGITGGGAPAPDCGTPPRRDRRC